MGGHQKFIKKTCFLMVCCYMGVPSISAHVMTPQTQLSDHTIFSAQEPLTIEEAITTTLNQNPTILIDEQSLISARASTQGTRGIFDWNLSSSFNFSKSTPPTTQNFDTTSQSESFSLSASKTMRTGMVFTPSLNASRGSNNRNDFLNLRPSSSSGIGFTLSMPVLRGSTIGLSEVSAEISEAAAEDTFVFSLSNVTKNVISAYWDYASAKANLDLRKKSEEVSKEFTGKIQRLIDAKEKPESEIKLAKADEASKRISRISAEQALLTAKNNLGVLMGLPLDVIDRIGLPATEFPNINNMLVDKYSKNPSLVTLITQRRYDLLAGEKSLQAQEVNLQQTKNSVLPSLDLSFGAGYDYVRDGGDMFASFGASEGKRANAGVSFSFPVPNNSARAGLISAIAGLKQANISYREQIKQAKLNLEVAQTAFWRAALQLEQSNLAVENYVEALNNENKKLSLGVATIIDVIRVRDQLISAVSQRINDQANYAKALTEIKFQAGILINLQQGKYYIDFTELK